MRRYKIFGYTLIAIGLYIVWNAIALPLAADHTPLCGRCHAVRQAYRTAGFSKHRNIGCLACHRNTGIGGRITNDFLGVKNIVLTVTGGRGSDRRVENDNCLACHDKIMDDTTSGGAVKMSHREVIDAGWRCSECHGNTGHRLPKLKTEVSLPSMDKCFGCHASSVRLKKCPLCHTDDIIEANVPRKVSAMSNAAHTKKWVRKEHGRSSDKLCPTCHEKTFCKRCHKTSLPHTAGSWPYQHSTAAVINKKSCKGCHKSSFCVDCHKMPMPHEKGYGRQHVVGAAGAEKICSNCHFKNQCFICHQTHQRHKMRRRS